MKGEKTKMINQVRKRDGQIQEFNKTKIAISIKLKKIIIGHFFLQNNHLIRLLN